jgi:hypothetical protein
VHLGAGVLAVVVLVGLVAARTHHLNGQFGQFF